jgi:hypothetical protein
MRRAVDLLYPPRRLGVSLGVSGLLATLFIAACGGGSPTNTPTTYSSKAFVLPFDVAPPTWQPTAPSVDESNFVTWVSPDDTRAVRFMVPVNVYPPGGTGTTPPPRDYLAYLLAQTDHGAQFADVTEAHVGGRPATIVTATVGSGLSGSIGCPKAGMSADDCFGLQPELVLRIAVIDFADKTLLIWLRLPRAWPVNKMTTEIKSFENMLTSIRFRDRVAADA